MVPKLLTDAKETSYEIFSPLLTAECSTVELPGKRTTALFSFYYENSRHAMSIRYRAECSQQLSCWEVSRFVKVG